MVYIPWLLKQYRNCFSSLYDESGEDIQVTIDHRIDFLIERGNRSGPPHTKHLRNQIYELRAKDRRFLFYFGPDREIVFVHSLIKKRDEVGEKAIRLSEERRQAILEGREGTNDVELQKDDSGEAEEPPLST